MGDYTLTNKITIRDKIAFRIIRFGFRIATKNNPKKGMFRYELNGNSYTFENVFHRLTKMENKTALLPINQKELSHLINDVIAYIWKLEGRGCATEEFGYNSRKELLEKLQQFEKENFVMFKECQK